MNQDYRTVHFPHKYLQSWGHRFNAFGMNNSHCSISFTDNIKIWPLLMWASTCCALWKIGHQVPAVRPGSVAAPWRTMVANNITQVRHEIAPKWCSFQCKSWHMPCDFMLSNLLTVSVRGRAGCKQFHEVDNKHIQWGFQRPRASYGRMWPPVNWLGDPEELLFPLWNSKIENRCEKILTVDSFRYIKFRQSLRQDINFSGQWV